MKIFDKAEWQIDGGINKTIVVKHFKFIFDWLKANDMLSEDGLEIFDVGIDEETSLHERLVTCDGCKFLEKNYDELISKSKYDIEIAKNLIDEMYAQLD